MTAARLLEHFDRVSEAPGAVPRLRRFILDLAVRGKLVEQDPSERPPAMPDRGWAKQTRSFVIPDSWIWARVDDVADCRLGKMLDKAKNRGTPKRYLRNVNVRWFDFDLSDVFEMPFEDSELEEFALRRGDVLVCEGGEPGRAAVWDERAPDIYFQKAIHRVRLSKAVAPAYFVDVLRASANDGTLDTHFTGVTIKHLTGRSLASFRFPVPPLPEQLRVVSRVDELMALCDRLESAQAERETRRARVVAASLQRVNEPAEAPQFRANAHFHMTNLPRLTSRLEHVKKLREAVLNWGVRGHLVPQHHSEEAALSVLKATEDARSPRLRADRNRSETTSLKSGAPFSIPPTWIWTRVHQCFEVAGGIQKTPHRTPVRNHYPYVGVANVYRGKLDLSQVKRFELTESEFEKLRLRAGDILVVEGNGSASEVGRCAIWNGEIADCVHQNHIIRCRPLNPDISPYVLRYLNSPDGVEVMKALAVTSSGLYNLSVGKIRNITFPLPPLAEQKRIVAKVDELMAVCDRLEAQITSAATESSRLIESLLHEALADPKTAHLMEAR